MGMILLIIFFYYNILFLISLKAKNNGIADVGWGLAFVLISTLFLFQIPVIYPLQIIIYGLVIVWGLRLILHIYSRNKGKLEDYRYAEWRKAWGKTFLIRSYSQVYILQMVFMLLIASPLLILQWSHHEKNIEMISWLGIFISLLGLCYESVSDWQLAQFKKNKHHQHKIMKEGLWRFSRHPNYFGESCFWFGIALAIFPLEYGYIGFISFLTITTLLRFVSGVPLLEKKAMQNPEFVTYAAKTSCMIPWFSKSTQENRHEDT